jgi:hypothetical protein
VDEVLKAFIRDRVENLLTLSCVEDSMPITTPLGFLIRRIGLAVM